MPEMDRKAAARSLFDAYRTKDRQIVEDLLAGDFTFTSPYDEAIDRAAYFERCWPNSELIREHVLEKVVEDGDDIIVLYRCLTRDGREFRNMEMLSFEGARLKAVNVYFGAGYRDGVFQKQA